jgi:hypothetical protein
MGVRKNSGMTTYNDMMALFAQTDGCAEPGYTSTDDDDAEGTGGVIDWHCGLFLIAYSVSNIYYPCILLN